MSKGVAMIQCQSKRSDKPSEVERFAASSANGMNVGQEKGCDIDLLAGEGAVHEKELFGVELMVTVSCKNGVAKNSVEVTNGRIMDLCGIEVIVGADTVVG